MEAVLGQNLDALCKRFSLDCVKEGRLDRPLS